MKDGGLDGSRKNTRRELPGTNKRHLSDEGCEFLREGVNSTSETDSSKGV